MKTIQELHELGIKSLSLNSSITRKFLSRKELAEITKNSDFVELFNLSHSKKLLIINSLKSGSDFYFQGKKIDISSLNFLTNELIMVKYVFD